MDRLKTLQVFHSSFFFFNTTSLTTNTGERRVATAAGGGSCLQNGVVLPCVLGVVALQQAAAHGGAGACKLCHVEVGEAQLRGATVA